MKTVKELSLQECQEVLDRILVAMFADLDAQGRRILNPDLPWSPSTLADIDMALESYEIRPYEVVELPDPDEHSDVCACGDPNCSRMTNRE